MPRGGWNRKSDEERKASGSYRPSRSTEAKERRLADNIFAGPGFQDVPDPTFSLAGQGVKEYFQICGRLLREGRLTESTRRVVEQYAMLAEDVVARKACGRSVPAYVIREMNKQMAMLKLAEDTQPVGANVGAAPKENPFDLCGALVRPFAADRLRRPSSAPA